MIHIVKALIRGKQPDWTDMTIPPEQDFRRFADKLDYQAKDANGNYLHPKLDSTVKKFADEKIKDYDRMVRWRTKRMKGFK
jgi:hypothetical protein